MPISVVDSLSTSAGLQLMVEAALKAAAVGESRQDIADRIEVIRENVRLIFVVDTLEYLAKGGRIGNARALLGTVLKVKPILSLQDGVIEPLEQVRSKRKAVARVLDLVVEYLADRCSEANVGIINALVPEEAESLAQEAQARLACADPFVSSIGPVIGTHTGPGAIGVAAYV
jgi:DegV family protein with EDD domain